MAHSTSRRRTFAAAALAALAGLAATAIGHPANADTFLPTNNTPTVSSPAFTFPGVQTAFEPDGGASDEVYTFSATVGDLDTLNDLSSVTLCLYSSADADAAVTAESVTQCTAPGAKGAVLMTWTRSTNAFTIDDGSANTYWAMDAASSAPADLTASTGTVSFKFTVGEAMREGTWTAKVTVTDTSAASATNSTQTASVRHYAAITARTQKSFGTVNALTGATQSDTPTVTANGKTALTMAAGNFTDGTYSFTLKTDGVVTDNPASGQVTFDCNALAVYDDVTGKRVGTSATLIADLVTADGTAEGGAATNNTCRLKHGGGRPVSTYAYTVVNGVQQS